MKKGNLLYALVNVTVLCVVVLGVSGLFVYRTRIIGYVLVLLGFVCIASLRVFRAPISSLKPDIVFGVIDNGILAVMAVVGGQIAGVAGAIIGGVVGNAVTDGIAGVFEGYYAESLAADKRTLLGSAVGKMAGCLFGAGGVLVIQGLL